MTPRATLAALADTFAADTPASDAVLAPPHADVARFLEEALADLPDYLRAPIALLTWVFDWSCLPFSGAPFHASTEAARRRHVAAWARSPLSPMRDLMRLYRSLSAYALYARLDGCA